MAVVLISISFFVIISAQVQKVEKSQFTIELVPGKYYQTYTTWLVFKKKIYPQVAVWLEHEDGRYIKTLYVTEKGGKNKWMSAPENGRPEALPVWSHLKKESYDALTSATSGSKTVRNIKFSELNKGKYIVKLEANRSYDYNEFYTRKNSGVNGQPSLIYYAILNINDKRLKAEFKPTGTGSVDGKDGEIRNELNHIDTALELFQELSISWVPVHTHK